MRLTDWIVLTVCGVLLAAPGKAQTRVDLRGQGRNVDFSGATTTRPARTGTQLPATCSVGEIVFKTDAVAGDNLFGCTAANTWNVLGLPVGTMTQLSPGSPGGVLVACGDGICTVQSDAGYNATQGGDNVFIGLNDFSNAASLRVRSGISLPASCSVAEIFFNTSAPAGQNWYGCTSTNTWMVLGRADIQATATPGPNAIPLATSGGKLALGWIASGTPDGTKFVRDDGTLATPPGGSGNDTRATATPGPNAIPLATSGGKLALGWIASGTPDGTKFVRDDGTLATPPGGIAAVTGSNGIAAVTAAGTVALTLDATAATQNGNNHFSGATSYPPSATQTLASATDAIQCNATTVVVSPNSNLTLSSAPTIAAGSDGQLCRVLNANGTNTLTLQDAGSLAGSLLGLYSATVALGPGQVLSLMYSAGQGRWRELSAPNGSGNSSYTFRDGMTASAGIVDVTPDPSVMVLVDDFPAGQVGATPFGQLNWVWSSSGTGATSASIAAVAGHPAVKTMTSGNASGNFYSIQLGGYAGTIDTFANLGAGGDFSSWEAHYIVQVDNVAGAAAISNLAACFGFMASGPACGYGIAVVADTAPTVSCTTGTWNAAHWMLVTAVAGPLTNCVDTNVPANSGTWYHFKIYSPTAGTIKLAINGTDAATSSSYVPNVSIVPRMSIYTHTSASKTAWVDYFSFKGRGLLR